MPNICTNNLAIRGNKAEIIELVWLVALPPAAFSLEAFIPDPNFGWCREQYQWRIENWGINRDILESDVTMMEDGVAFSFQTAWDAPVKAIGKLAEMFPSLSFDYDFGERGMNFTGHVVFENGVQTERKDGTYSDMEEENETN